MRTENPTQRLAELTRQRDEARRKLEEEHERHEQAVADWEADIELIEQERRAIQRGLIYSEIKLAEELLYVRGSAARIAEHGSGEPYDREPNPVEDAISDIAEGGEKLQRRYFAFKQYDRWHAQRSDHKYGYGPRHGSVVFAIGLTSAGRKSVPLGEAERNACIYLLEALKAGDYPLDNPDEKKGA
jgi:hypothetical protein